MRTHLYRLAFLCVTGLILTHPLYLHFFPNLDVPFFDNRSITALPSYTKVSDLIALSHQMDDYLADHLPLRNRMITGLYWFERAVLQDKVFPQVVIGKNNWMYYSGENNLSIYQRDIPFDNEQLVSIRDNLEAAQDWLSLRGIQMVVVIAPDKETIYPENLPDFVPLIGKTSQLDQLLAYLNIHGNFRILDPRADLIEVKKSYQVYYQTDTHWNQIGCQIAYKAILDQIAVKFPNLFPHTMDDYEITTSLIQGDLMRFIGQANAYETVPFSLTPLYPVRARSITGSNNFRTEMTVNDPSLPRMLMLNDSFGTCLRPFLAEHFSYSLYYWMPFPTPSVLEQQLVDQVNPDVVIIEIAERYIGPRLIPIP